MLRSTPQHGAVVGNSRMGTLKSTLTVWLLYLLVVSWMSVATAEVLNKKEAQECENVTEFKLRHIFENVANSQDNSEALQVIMSSISSLRDAIDTAETLLMSDMREVSFRTTRGTARATSIWSDEYSAQQGFARPGYTWHAVTGAIAPQSIWYEFPQVLRVVKYSFQSRTDEHSQHIVDQGTSRYEFWGSNGTDCSSKEGRVTLVEDISNTPFSSQNTPKVENVENLHGYRCYGFTINANPGNKNFGMSNIRLFYARGVAKQPIVKHGETLINRDIIQNLANNISNPDETCPQNMLEQHGKTKWSSLIIPSSGTTKMSWLDSWSRCQSLGAQPFVPRTLRDFEVIKSVRLALGEQTALWLPASDLSQEGILKWWDGKDASGSQGLVWVGNQELHDNKEAHDCLMYGYPHGGVHMHVCSEHWYPMICYKN